MHPSPATVLGSIVFLLMSGCSEAASSTQEPTPRGEQQCGISASHPEDLGIGSHPSVLLHEDFEHGLVSRLEDRFSSVRNPGNLVFSSEVSEASPGQRSLLMRSIGGQDTGAHLFGLVEPGHDRLHLRYYVRYDRSHRYHHSGGGLGGYHPPTPWPQGGAGTRPAGDDRFTIRVEPMPGGAALDLYTYWMEMRGNPGDSSYWGNTFMGGQRPGVPDREWFAVEFMVKMNEPGRSDGELALWIDGEPVAHLKEGDPVGEWVWDTFHPDAGNVPFEGFRWRTDPRLNINFVWLSHYVTGHGGGETSEVHFNDVVLATEYIGPIGGGECR